MARHESRLRCRPRFVFPRATPDAPVFCLGAVPRPVRYGASRFWCTRGACREMRQAESRRAEVPLLKGRQAKKSSAPLHASKDFLRPLRTLPSHEKNSGRVRESTPREKGLLPPKTPLRFQALTNKKGKGRTRARTPPAATRSPGAAAPAATRTTTVKR